MKNKHFQSFTTIVLIALTAAFCLSDSVRAGAIVAWGSDSSVVNNTPTGNDFTAIASGGNHGLALTANGSIVSWGRDTSDQVLNTPTESGFTTITGGEYHSLALTADGSIVAWGYDGYGQVSGTPTGSGFIDIAAGNDHSIALIPEPCTLILLALGGLVMKRMYKQQGK